MAGFVLDTDMDEEQIRQILDTVPGSRRAAEGVILEGEGGSTFHITGIFKTDTELSHSEHFYLAFCSRNEILRLREIRTPHDYLLRLRAEAVVHEPRIVRAFKSRRKSFESAGRIWSLSEYYQTRNVDVKRYIKRLSRRQQKLLKAIPFGMAPIKEANAEARASLSGDIVIVSESLEYFFYFMNIATFGPSLGIPIGDCIDAATIAIRIMRGSESFDFDIDPRCILPSEIEQSVQSLRGFQMEFVFGHEFAHILLGHLNEQIDVAPDIRTYAQVSEFEADINAIQQVTNDRSAKWKLLNAGLQVLLFLHFLEKCAEYGLLPSFTVARTHPSALDRIWHLHNSVGSMFEVPQELLTKNIDSMENMAIVVRDRLAAAERKDLLDFYGSMYLLSFKKRRLKDRIDF
jgi:hypothetical protein